MKFNLSLKISFLSRWDTESLLVKKVTLSRLWTPTGSKGSTYDN